MKKSKKIFFVIIIIILLSFFKNMTYAATYPNFLASLEAWTCEGGKAYQQYGTPNKRPEVGKKFLTEYNGYSTSWRGYTKSIGENSTEAYCCVGAEVTLYHTFLDAGYSQEQIEKIMPMEGQTGDAMNWAKERNLWHLKGEYTPKPGDIIICSGGHHTELVTKVTEDKVSTLNLNKDGTISPMEYDKDKPRIYGYIDIQYNSVTPNSTDSSNVFVDTGKALLNAIINLFATICDAIQSTITKIMLGITSKQADVLVSDTSLYPNLNFASSETEPVWWKQTEATNEEDSEAMDTSGDGAVVDSNGTASYYINATNYLKKYRYVNMRYSPEEIFANSVDILNINFFDTDVEGELVAIIRKVIIYWFRGLRYLGLVGLLSVLIYIGIKVMLSSSTTKKVDFKQAIVSWVIGIVLMFTLPYIMSFIMTMGSKITELFISTPSSSVDIYVYDEGGHEGKATYSKFSTNLMGLVRFQMENSEITKRVGFLIMYIMLIIMNVRFTIMYLKRIIYMAYLTMIAPIIALMYPIDKTTSGGAQGFNEWIRGYTYNAFIQPVHLLVYYILIGSAMEFAMKNVLYTIVVLGFIAQLESMITKIIGLQSSEAGGGKDFASSALGMSSIVNSVTHVASMVGNNISKLKKGAGDNKKAIDNNSQNNTEKPDYGKDFSSGSGIPADSQSSENNNNDENKDNNSQETINNEKPEGEKGANNGNTVPNDDTDKDRQEEGSDDDDNENEQEDAPEQEDDEDKGKKEADEKEKEEKPKGKKFTDPKAAIKELANRRLAEVGYNLGYRKENGFKDNVKSIGANVGKRTLKGVKKGVKMGTGVALGTTVAVGQAAISLASDGQYSILEGIGTVAATTAGTNKLMNSAGRKIGKLKEEFKETKYGKEAIEKEKRKKQFRENKEAYKEYKSKYADKGNAEMRNRIDLGEKLAGDGIENINEQMQVMNYIDRMVDKDYNKKYGKMTEEQREKEAKSIQEKNRNLAGMSTEQALKWNMKNNDESYRDIAVKTAKAKKDIPESMVYGDEKKWKNFVNSRSLGNKQTEEGYEIARRNIREMNLAQRKDKK